MTNRLRLGVNVDHVATVRNARGVGYPDPVRAALLACEAGADGITAHLREDRRHIRDEDMRRLKEALPVPLNFEMAPTDAMVEIASATAPHAVCLVPERREELTTEGGLDAAGLGSALGSRVEALAAAGIRVSLFVEPAPEQLHAAVALGAPVVELHTGRYCELVGRERQAELKRIRAAAALASELGLECHAGHGLTYDNVGPIAAVGTVVELNIGHFLVGEAIFVGFVEAVRRMRAAMDRSR